MRSRASDILDMMRNKAFTLIELLVVISIIALLSSVVLASLNSAREKGRIAAGRQFEAEIYHIAGDYASAVWDLDDCSGTTALDRSGNDKNGTLTNGPTWSTDTPTGKGCSLSFDGVDDYMNSSLSLSADAAHPATISAWIKTSDASGVDPIIGHGVGGRIDAWRDGTVLRCRGFDTVDNTAYGTTRISDGKWHLVACVFDSTGVKAYTDGKLEGTNPSPTNAGSGTMYVSKSGSGVPSASFTGLIDSVRIFSKDLTASEVGDMYAADKKHHEMASI